MAEPNKGTNLNDLPYDEYQKEMARMEAEAAQQAKDKALGQTPMQESEDDSGLDSFLSKNKTDAKQSVPSDESVPPDQAGDAMTGEADNVTADNNPDAFEAKSSMEEQMTKKGAAGSLSQKAGKSLSSAFKNFFSGMRGLFTGGTGIILQKVVSLGSSLGLPKAATYGLLFVLGGGTFAGIAALLGGNSDLLKYGSTVDDCKPVSIIYHENSVYKAPTQAELDGRAGALFNVLNSDMHFNYGIRDSSTRNSPTDDVTSGSASYYYTQPLADRYDWNNDGVVNAEDDRSRLIKGGYYHHEDTVHAFQDEQVLGMIMNASAESKIDPACYEMNYRVGPTENAEYTSDYYVGLPDTTKDLILSSTHHTQWNTYVPRMFALYAAAGTSIHQATYTYVDQWGNSTDKRGDQNYYPGVGLWQWTGQRGFNLSWFANQLKDNTDADGDGANDAMYSLNVQIAFLVEIEAKPVKVNHVENKITDWGKAVVSSYQEEYYVDVPYKNSIGTAPGGEANWIPVDDYQDPSKRHMTVAYDAYDQLRNQAKYKYESPTGARLSDKNKDDARDASYFQDSDRYDGNITAFDDAPFPVKDYIYNTDGSIKKDIKWKYVDNGTDKGYDTNDDGDLDDTDDFIIKEDGGDYYITDGNGHKYKGLDIDHEDADDDLGKIDVWDTDDDGVVDDYDEGNPDAGDWYVDHEGYNDADYKKGIFKATEVYYPNISIMVMAVSPHHYNADKYIYEDDGNCLRQYKDKETVADIQEKAKIIYQSPGITDTEIFPEQPWNDADTAGTYILCHYTDGDYKAIQRDDNLWTALEEARSDPDKYGTELHSNALRKIADAWRDDIWLWANAHARAAIARNKALEFAKGWLGCPDGMIEKHTMFVHSHASFAGRFEKAKLGDPQDCLEHYAECMLKTDWHGSDTTGKSVTDLLYEDMDTSAIRNVWNTYTNPCGGDFDNSSIAACAVSWAWLKGHPSDADVNLSVLDSTGCPKAYLCTSLYCAVHDIVFNGDGYYSSCDRGAGTAVRASGSDDSFPAGNPYVQYGYMMHNSDIWEDEGPIAAAWSNIKPGDIIVSTSADPRHIIVFVGEDAVKKKWPNVSGDAKHAIVHSSHSSNLSSSRGPRCDLDGSYLLSDSSHAFHVFRCKNEDTDSSAIKKEVDAQASTLGGLNNGDGKGGGYYAPQN